ncbi:MAG: MgtC/SapB family protein [Phycisphaerae bacterium]
MTVVTTEPFSSEPFAYQVIAFKSALSTGIGLLVGLEREWARKEIGVRTFATAGLLGMLTSLLSPEFVLGALVAVLLFVTLLNIHSLLKDRSLELTTSMCLVVVLFLGALVGLGHYFTASTAAIIVMLLLAWKLELERFAGALRPEEIRSAVLLGLLSVVVYPLLPDRFVDQWQVLNPRQYWITVVVIAGIGFVNYVLLRLYGNRGLLYAALLGGLVNSTAAVAELASMFKGREAESRRASAILLLTNVAMVIRNGVLLGIFAPAALASASGPLGLMAALAALFSWLRDGRQRASSTAPLQLSSPVSFRRVVKFSGLFLLIACIGTLAQRFFGGVGFLVVSILGGLVSSASTTASAATLVVTGKLDPTMAGIATVLTSVASSLVNLPIVYQQTHSKRLTSDLTIATFAIALAGIASVTLIWWLKI